jgi:segregation and condensation protein B
MLKTQIVEALLFASDAPLAAADLARGDESLDEDAVEAAVQALRAEYEQTGRSFQIYEVAGGYQLLTLPDYAPYLERFDTVPQTGRLSNPALEVLAIISYRQPIDRAEVEEIRGVGSSGVLRTLTDRGLIEVAGRGEGLGRPLLYGTTSKFLEHFGFRSLEDLPRPEELPVVLRDRSVPIRPEADEAEVEEVPTDVQEEMILGSSASGGKTEVVESAANGAGPAAGDDAPEE